MIKEAKIISALSDAMKEEAKQALKDGKEEHCLLLTYIAMALNHAAMKVLDLP